MLEHYEKAMLFLFILTVQTDSVNKCVLPIVMKPVLSIEDRFLS